MPAKTFAPKFLFIGIAILLAAISRLLPHPPNFTPIAAMALFGGACFSNNKLAFTVPLLAMIISDCLLELILGIGFHNTIIYVYASIITITGIGIFIRGKAKAGAIILASLASSVLFFLITNFGFWAAQGFQMGLSGLLISYVNGIPFYNNELFGSFFFNTIIGDLFYSGILFGSLYLAKSKFPVLA